MKTSGPSLRPIKPNPFELLNHFTVPVTVLSSWNDSVLCSRGCTMCASERQELYFVHPAISDIGDRCPGASSYGERRFKGRSRTLSVKIRSKRPPLSA